MTGLLVVILGEETVQSLFRSPNTELSELVELYSDLKMVGHTLGKDSAWSVLRSPGIELCELVGMYLEDGLEMAIHQGH